MQPPQDFSNLFLDMNAFFASVEQQVQPPLRGKPICIAPYTGASGCCIAKSYEAKAFGVNTGSRVGEAKKICPSLLVLESRPELYLFYHRQIKKIIESFSPFVQVLSIDEFNIKLTGSDQNKKAALAIGYKLKEAIKNKIGDYLTCSVGIGPNKWLAKVAGELQKPDGLVVIEQNNLAAIYEKMTLTDLPGINFRLEQQFKKKKINTVSDFFKAPLSDLSLWFGHPGRVWWYRLRGYEVDEISHPVKSIGHQHVLSPKYRNLIAARKVLAKMTQKCALRLRKQKLSAGGVALAISFLGHKFWRKIQKTDYFSDTQNLQRIALALYDDCQIINPPFKISVTLFNLRENRTRQISLFSREEKSLKISRALDNINDKFGPETIHFSSSLETMEAAPNRIPFGDPDRLEF